MLETWLLRCHRAGCSWIRSHVVVRPRHCCFPLGADEERSKTDGAQTAEMENTEERAVWKKYLIITWKTPSGNFSIMLNCTHFHAFRGCVLKTKVVIFFLGVHLPCFLVPSLAGLRPEPAPAARHCRAWCHQACGDQKARREAHPCRATVSSPLCSPTPWGHWGLH